MPAWSEISGVVSSHQADYVSELLQAEGAVAISFLPVDDELLVRDGKSSNELWSTVEVKGLFPLSITPDAVVKNLALIDDEFKHIDWAFNQVEDLDWVRLTQENFTPVLINDCLWVCPEGHALTVQDKQQALFINPGLAFGTGSHPTTHLCLQWLCDAQLAGKTVLDYGCGSGILACAAAILGARNVTGVDNDEQAITASVSNASLNPDAAAVTWFLSDDYKAAPADIIIANILAPPLLQLKSMFSEILSPGGVCVLSGLLETDVEDIVNSYSTDFELRTCVVAGDWARLELLRI